MLKDRTVLFVDDEKSVLNALQRALHSEHYRIMTADNAQQALAILNNNAIDLVISDQHMPETTGADLLRQIHQTHPHIIRIMMTGNPHSDIMLQAINEGHIYGFFTKPWDMDEIRETITDCLQHTEKGHFEAALKEVDDLKHLLQVQQLEIAQLRQQLDRRTIL